jgi:hypothetical protein
MGHFAIPLVIAGGVLTAVAQRNAGKAESIELQQQAKQEESAAKDRELIRRRQLVRSLSTQIATFGALGVDAGTGSPASISLRDGRLADEETAIDRTRTQQQSNSLRRQAKSARRIGNLRAAGTLFATAGAAAGMSGGGEEAAAAAG